MSGYRLVGCIRCLYVWLGCRLCRSCRELASRHYRIAAAAWLAYAYASLGRCNLRVWCITFPSSGAPRRHHCREHTPIRPAHWARVMAPVSGVLVDCHAHCYTPQYDSQVLFELLEEAACNGVSAVVTVPESLEDCNTVVHLSKSHPIIKPCAGLHPVQPTHSDGPYSGARCVALAELQPALQFIQQNQALLVAVGEVGLDFSPHIIGDSQEARLIQQQVFTAQIQLANELGLPVNVHSRSAGHYAIDTLIQSNATGALLHAFDGRVTHALKAASAGYYLSVPASVVRSPHMQKLVQVLPLDHLVLETDSPALPPEKSGINRPLNVKMACEYVAKAKGLSYEEVASITTSNACKLFPKLAQQLAAVEPQ